MADIDEIDPAALPDQFVLKANHGSSWNVICRDKAALDWRDTRRKFKRWMKRNYYYHAAEWCYRDIRPRIICERYLESEPGLLRQYNVHCINGRPTWFAAHNWHPTNSMMRIYDLNWRRLGPLPATVVRRMSPTINRSLAECHWRKPLAVSSASACACTAMCNGPLCSTAVNRRPERRS